MDRAKQYLFSALAKLMVLSLHGRVIDTAVGDRTLLSSDIRRSASPYRRPNSFSMSAELQLHIGGAAVVALAGVRRGLHLAQQGVHLRRR